MGKGMNGGIGGLADEEMGRETEKRMGEWVDEEISGDGWRNGWMVGKGMGRGM